MEENELKKRKKKCVPAKGEKKRLEEEQKRIKYEKLNKKDGEKYRKKRMRLAKRRKNAK